MFGKDNIDDQEAEPDQAGGGYSYSTVHNKRSYSNNHSYLNLQTKSIIVATGIIIPSGKKLGMNF